MVLRQLSERLRIRKVEGQASRKQRLREVLKNHEDETLPSFSDAKLAIVLPTFRELSNGNIFNILKNLLGADLELKKKFMLLFVVNNPRIYAFIAEHFDHIKSGNLEVFFDIFNKTWKMNGWNVSENEKVFLENVRKGESQKIERMYSSYQENQFTLEVLRLR